MSTKSFKHLLSIINAPERKRIECDLAWDKHKAEQYVAPPKRKRPGTNAEASGSARQNS